MLGLRRAGGARGEQEGGQSYLEACSQLLPAPHRKLREEELRTTSLPSIPNPFPELCSPSSQSPILGGPSSARGLLPRDASCPHVSCPGKEKAGM